MPTGTSMADGFIMTDETSLQAVPHEKQIIAEIYGPQNFGMEDDKAILVDGRRQGLR